jgi:hypothetical protein
VLSIIGIICLAVSGWLGGELVYIHGIAVRPQAVSLHTESDMWEKEYWAAYSYIAEKRRDRRLEGKEWPEVEEELRRDWDKDHPGTWVRFKDTIHSGWDALH